MSPATVGRMACTAPQSAPLLSAGFPLTDTTLSTSFTVATAHDPASMDWQTLARAGTLVLLMAGSHLAAIMEHLQAAGRPAHEPVSCLRVDPTSSVCVVMLQHLKLWQANATDHQ